MSYVDMYILRSWFIVHFHELCTYLAWRNDRDICTYIRTYVCYVYGTMQKGSTLLTKVRDIIASRKDLRTGCNLYTILAHYTD